jgi:hypothetical protein
MAEPAWDYAAYHSIWKITAEDYELEGRLKALEQKVSLWVWQQQAGGSEAAGFT